MAGPRKGVGECPNSARFGTGDMTINAYCTTSEAVISPSWLSENAISLIMIMTSIICMCSASIPAHLCLCYS